MHYGNHAATVQKIRKDVLHLTGLSGWKRTEDPPATGVKHQAPIERKTTTIGVSIIRENGGVSPHAAHRETVYFYPWFICDSGMDAEPEDSQNAQQ
jgi:hypothetical protein